MPRIAAGAANCIVHEAAANGGKCDVTHKGPVLWSTGPFISSGSQGQTEVRFLVRLCHGALAAAAGMYNRKTCAIVPASGRNDVHQLARAVNVGFWLRRPLLLPSRVAYWVWEKLNLGKPWLCKGAVAYCERVLTKSMTALEFGSGRSTAWFAKHVGRLTSVEHDSGWHSQIAATLERKRIANVDYRLVPLDHQEDEPERATYEPLPAYVAVLNAFDNESLDLVVVDGHYRTTCIVNSLSKLRPNGLLLVDDVNLWPSESAVPVPTDWPLVSRSSNGIKRTCVWRKPREEN